MMILITIGLSLLSLALIFAVTKLFGNKQVSQMNLFDYVMGITIGSIAAELSTELENPIQPITAIIVYGAVGFIIAIATNKSTALRRWITGKPEILMENNIIHKHLLEKAHVDINEFLAIARQEGYYDISQVETAIIEHTGRISFLPKTQYRPVTPDDLKMPVQKEHRFLNLIQDGLIMENELKALNKDSAWLSAKLKENGFKSEKDVFLMTMDTEENIHFYAVE